MENACNRQASFSSLFLVPTLQTLPFTFTAGNIPSSQPQPEAAVPGHAVRELSTQLDAAGGGGETSQVPAGTVLLLPELRPAEPDQEPEHHCATATNQAGTRVGRGLIPSWAFQVGISKSACFSHCCCTRNMPPVILPYKALLHFPASLFSAGKCSCSPMEDRQRSSRALVDVAAAGCG